MPDKLKKACTRCKANKLITEYHKKGDRLDSQCSSCISNKRRKKRTTSHNNRRTFSISDIEVYGVISEKQIDSMAKMIGQLIIEADEDEKKDNKI